MGTSKSVGPVLLAAVLLSGCGGGGGAQPAATVTVTETAEPPSAPTTEAPAAKADAPVIAEQATHVENPFGDTFQVFYTVVITNPNEDLYGSFPTFSVTARDAAGGVLGTQDQVLLGLPPGGRVAFGSLMEATAEPASVDIAFKTVDWTATSTVSTDYPAFAATPRLTENTYGGWTVSGDVQNAFAARVPADQVR